MIEKSQGISSFTEKEVNDYEQGIRKYEKVGEINRLKNERQQEKEKTQ